jgi:cobalt-zinc-cadmium resistance protein CzcA
VHLRIVYDQADLVRASLGGLGRASCWRGVRRGDDHLVARQRPRRSAGHLDHSAVAARAALALRQLDVGLNAMTLGGLAIAVGLMVDSAIIVTENVLHRLSGGRQAAPKVGHIRSTGSGTSDRLRHAHRGGGVRSPVRDDRNRGRMYRPLAAAVVTAVLTSLLLSLT